MRFMNRNRNNEPLSNEQIQKLAPSAFAGQPHESRSNRYTFIPTSDVIEGLRQAGFSPVSAMQSTSRIAGKEFFTKHMIRFRSPETNLTQVGDTTVEAILMNSHDGTSQYTIALGAFRLACLNGLIVSEGFAESIKVRHTGNIIERVIESTHSLIQMAPKVITAIREWKQILLSNDEQLLLAQAALDVRFEDNPPVTADRLLVAHRNADVPNDLYTVFNRIQENVVRGGLRYETPSLPQGNGGYSIPRKNRTREVKGIDQNTRLNRALWTLAEEMAKLKQ